MKKQFSLLKGILILVGILMALQIVMLCLEPDLKHIILTAVCGAGFVGVLILFIVSLINVKKIVFEYDDADVLVRLVEYDDYQKVREFLCEEELDNSEEEVKRLEEYSKITTDYVRMPYHYMIFKNNQLICIFYAKTEKDAIHVSFVKTIEEDKMKEMIVTLGSRSKKEIIFE